jgi:3-dehydroquinate synthase
MNMKTDLAEIDGDLPDAATLVALMAQDKKVVDGQLKFILASAIGKSFITSDVPKEPVFDLLNEALRHKNQ